MFTISDRTIKELAANNRVYEKGLAYCRQGRVSIFDFGEENLCVSGKVFGSDEYQVEVCFSIAGEITDMYCDCPGFIQYEGACKHIVAFLRYYQQQQMDRKKLAAARSGNSVVNTRLAEDIFEYYESLKKASKKPVSLEITIEEKIYNLQQKKKAMPESVIKPGETMLFKMTEQEGRELLGVNS